jgi:hypothetical protein
VSAELPPSAKGTKIDYLLRLTSLPSSIPATVRLRWLLKAMGRGYAFRCVSAEEVPVNGRKQPRKAAGATRDAAGAG